MGKTWPALDIHVPGCDPQLQELVLAELDDFHPTAIQEPGDAPTPQLRAFFSNPDSRTAAASALGAVFGIHVFVQPVDVADDDWAARSQAQLRAVTIDGVVVAPPWDVPEKGTSSAMTVVIQPSMGFGTGHHATTRLTLRALQCLNVNQRTVLDIGCGSGVLAIAAVILGAQSAIGVDIDPDAIGNARENAELNSMATPLTFEGRDFRELSRGADIVLANLTGGLLANSAAKIAALVNPGGHLIVSGFTNSEDDAVIPSLGRFLVLQKVDAEDEWRCATYSSGKGAAI